MLVSLEQQYNKNRKIKLISFISQIKYYVANAEQT